MQHPALLKVARLASGFAIGLAWSVMGEPALAQVHRCVGADGKVEYRAQPCPANTTGRELVPAATPQNRKDDAVGVPFTFGGQLKPLPGATLPSQDAPPRDLAAGAEVVLISGYESGASANRVIVHRPGKQVLLVLSSYSRINWKIEPEANTVIKGVLLARPSEGRSAVAAPAGVRVFDVRLPYSTAAESQGFRDQMKQLNAWFGIDRVDSYRGDYRVADKTEIFRVDPARPEQTLAGVQPQAPDVKFGFDLLATDLRRVPWTNAGPASPSAPTGARLSNGKLASAGSGKPAYKLDGDELRMLPPDGSGRGTSVAPLPANFPKFSWPMDVAYDTRQDIVAVVTLGGEGFVYRFDARRNQWLDFRSLNNIDINSLAYDAGNRRYLAWTTEGELVILSDDGRVVSSKAIASQLSDLGSLYDKGNQRVPRLALVPQGDWLAMLNLTESSASHIWTLNLKTGQIKLTYKTPVVSAPVPVAASRPGSGSADRGAVVPPVPVTPPPKPVPLVKLPLLEATPPRALAAGAEVLMVYGDKGPTAVTKVVVHRPGKQVLLVLASYDKVSWQVEPEASTVIRGIVVSAHRGKSDLVGPEATRGYSYMLPHADGSAFLLKAYLKALNALFGIDKLDVYRNEGSLPASVEIYATEANRPELTLAGIQSEAAQSKFSFDLLDADLRWVPWTNTGPGANAGAGARLAGGRVAVSGAGKTVYRLDKNELRATDRDGKALAVAPLPGHFPKFSWAMDLAYDTQQDILSVIARGDGGTFYRYDARRNKWLDFHHTDNVYANSLAYDPTARRYVAWSRKGDLLLISKDGVVESSTKVTALLQDYDAAVEASETPDVRMTLAPRGDWVAIINPAGSGASHIWSYNIKTGQAQLTHKAASGGSSPGPSSRSAASR